ncbi:hypothetical protein PAT3040_05103 [Paenibacillus agaridevorans]|uniref:Uncharacterized protein n=1 Tax=Paenibacillus agaridevorans TaxID=171404 RepID=A0A2R5EUK1_9BACL|nr:hypothetical protein PAT3040_05103 [Paenibacillus agaridevorans]
MATMTGRITIVSVKFGEYPLWFVRMYVMLIITPSAIAIKMVATAEPKVIVVSAVVGLNKL